MEEREAMRVKTIGWIVGSLGLLVGAGTAWGNEDTSSTPSTTGSDMAAKPAAGMPECKDAGVTVAFKTGSSELDQNARGALDGVATWMKADPQRTMHLEGFADTTGDTEANLVLSAKRAEAVKNYLIEHGVSSNNVMTVGRGEETDHLPANGRAVTFLACASNATSGQVAQAEAEMPPVAPPPPAEAPVEAAPVVTPVAAPAPPRDPYYLRGFGFAVMAGGAYQDFTNDTMRNVTQGGGGWDARFIAGTNSIIALEGAYVGSANQINGFTGNLGNISGNTPTLVGNGLEGNARLNIPLRVGYHLFEPYGFAGIGYQHMTISNYNANTQTLSSFSQSDNIMTVPVGGGFAYAYKQFILDARAGWTATYYNNLLANTSGSGTLDHWNIGGQVGFRF
jgi:outer membrane protein OmpA-like peptidoglycan-associated protein